MNQRWAEIGRKGAASVKDAEHGSILTHRTEVAGALGVTRQTLRNYVAAWRFVEALRRTDPEIADALMAMPATAVAVYERWIRRDRPSAIEHILESKRMHRSVAAIVAAERGARQGLDQDGPQGPLETALSRGSGDRAKRPGQLVTQMLKRSLPLVPTWPELSLVANSIPLSLGMGAAQALRWKVDLKQHPEMRYLQGRPFYRSHAWEAQAELDVVAVIEAGRGQVGDAHRRNAKTLLARAALAATAHPMVMVLVEDAAAVDDFVEMVETLEAPEVTGSGGPAGKHYRFSSDGGSVAIMPAEGFVIAWHSDR